jgi:pimeloyl-ACP methyl ester carboxylesterase
VTGDSTTTSRHLARQPNAVTATATATYAGTAGRLLAGPAAAPAVQSGLVADRHGQGPAVVLLHGQPGSADDWDHVVPLIDGDFTVIVPDRLGYGRTGGVAGGFVANARALATLLDRLEISSAVIAGHSWAGGVALAFAQAYPARVTGLVLISSVGPGERFAWDDRLLAAPLLGETVAALTIGVTGRLLGRRRVQDLAARRLGARPRQAVDILTSVTGARSGAAAWRSFVVEQRALLRETDGLGAHLHRINVPATVVHGRADHLIPVALAENLAAAIPGADLTVIAGANHLLPQRYPDAVAGAVRAVAARRRTASLDEPRLDGEKAAHGER